MGSHLIQERVAAVGGDGENLDRAWPAEQPCHGLFRCQVGSCDHDIRTDGDDVGRIEFGAGQVCHDDQPWLARCYFPQDLTQHPRHPQQQYADWLHRHAFIVRSPPFSGCQAAKRMNHWTRKGSIPGSRMSGPRDWPADPRPGSKRFSGVSIYPQSFSVPGVWLPGPGQPGHLHPQHQPHLAHRDLGDQRRNPGRSSSITDTRPGGRPSTTAGSAQPVLQPRGLLMISNMPPGGLHTLPRAGHGADPGSCPRYAPAPASGSPQPPVAGPATSPGQHATSRSIGTPSTRNAAWQLSSGSTLHRVADAADCPGSGALPPSRSTACLLRPGHRPAAAWPAQPAGAGPPCR